MASSFLEQPEERLHPSTSVPDDRRSKKRERRRRLRAVHRWKTRIGITARHI
jgi:hypothetical protein